MILKMLCLSFEDCLILPIIMNLRMFVHIFQVLQSYGLLNLPNDPFEGGGAEAGQGWGGGGVGWWETGKGLLLVHYVCTVSVLLFLLLSCVAVVDFSLNSGIRFLYIGYSYHTMLKMKINILKSVWYMLFVEYFCLITNF